MTLIAWLESDLELPLLVNLVLNWLQGDAFHPTRRWHRLAGNQDPQWGAVRIIGRQRQSTIEIAFSQGGQKCDKQLWLPLPPMLNRFCLPIIQSLPSGKALLNDTQMEKWRWLCQPGNKTSVKRHPDITQLMLSYPTMHTTRWRHYFLHCAESDDTLNPLAKIWFTPLSNERAGHHYQRIGTDELRYALYNSVKNYIKHLTRALPNEVKTALPANRPARSMLMQLDTEASYITEIEGRIPERRLGTNGEGSYADVAPHYVGSHRALSSSQTITLLKSLRQNCNLKRPSRAAEKSRWFDYHNYLTSTLAIHLITTSGLRPTHSVSPNRYVLQSPVVKDKGQYRELWLSDWMQNTLKNYEKHRDSILGWAGALQDIEHLLFLFDASGRPSALSAKSLRIFMHTHLPGAVPYQLRHTFAQTLSTHSTPTHQLNRLMGHALDGEQLGASDQLGNDSTQLIRTLNRLTHYFRLAEVPLKW
ncbi:hypothetical protein P4S70_20395 [Enterovibrio sp. Hal110]